MIVRELLSLQQGRCEEGSLVIMLRCTMYHLSHFLLETKELKIAQSFPWCPLVISIYGL